MTLKPLVVLAIPGSTRRASYNRLLLQSAEELAPAGMSLQLYEELGDLPVFNEDLETDPPGVVRELRARVRGAQGLLFATPEYNQSIPGGLKNAIDWLSRPAPEHVLSGKPAAILGMTTGRWGTRYAQKELRHVLMATEARVLPAPQLFLAQARQAFEPSGRLKDGDTLEALRGLLGAFEKWIRS